MTSEVVNLRQKLADTELPVTEREKLIDRVAELATENVSFKATMEETKALLRRSEDRVKALEIELDGG